MAKEIGNIELKFDVTGLEDLTNLSRQLKNLGKIAKPAAGSFKGLINGIKDVTKFTPRTISQFKQKERTLKALRNEVKAGGVAFKKLGREIDANRIKLQAFNNTGKKGKGMFAGLGAGGAAAIGGAGAYIGSTLGLPPAITGLASMGAASAKASGGSVLAGGLAGAGIGAGVAGAAALIAGAKGAAEYSAQIRRLEVALKGVTKSQTEFAKAQKVIKSVSKELNVPIANANQQFTTLTASVIGAGGSVDEAEQVFRGVSEAIKATGGDAEDVKSAIRAMSQIFGKGKVSAEELQGQLGERLPGAVTKFAAATGRTLPQLQKDLRDGTVGLNDVMKFVVRLSDDHSEAAREMARSSADAGQRMQVTFDELKKSVGDILQPLGAEIQNMTEVAVNNLNRLIGGFRKFMKFGDEFKEENLEREIARLKDLTSFGLKDIGDLSNPITTFAQLGEFFMSGEMKEMFKEQLKAAETELRAVRERKQMMDQLKTQQVLGDVKDLTRIDTGNLLQPLGSFEDGKSGNVFEDPVSANLQNDTTKARAILDKYAESVKAVNQQIANSFVSTFKRLEDSLVEFVTTGTLNFRKFAQSIIQEMTRIFIRSQIMSPLMGMFKGMFGGGGGTNSSSFLMDFGGSSLGGYSSSFNPSTTSYSRNPLKNAKGNVFAGNKIVPYAMGGIVNKPTLFPMANGTGLMSEQGPEAIMPLKRGANGKLGVQSSGGVGNIVVNVDASGSSVEGDSAQSEQFGRALAAAIQSELIEQQRPGGLLT